VQLVEEQVTGLADKEAREARKQLQPELVRWEELKLLDFVWSPVELPLIPYKSGRKPTAYQWESFSGPWRYLEW